MMWIGGRFEVEEKLGKFYDYGSGVDTAIVDYLLNMKKRKNRKNRIKQFYNILHKLFSDANNFRGSGGDEKRGR